MSTLNNIPSNFIWNSSTIKSLRVYADMSQTDLAQRVGVDNKLLVNGKQIHIDQEVLLLRC